MVDIRVPTYLGIMRGERVSKHFGLSSNSILFPLSESEPSGLVPPWFRAVYPPGWEQSGRFEWVQGPLYPFIRLIGPFLVRSNARKARG